MHALLSHLHAAGFHGAPRPLGLDEPGREVLTFIPGVIPRPGSFRLLLAATLFAHDSAWLGVHDPARLGEQLARGPGPAGTEAWCVSAVARERAWDPWSRGSELDCCRW